MVEIISIGTELLMGNITDTNSRYIATQLTDNGYKVENISMVADDYRNLKSVIKNALSRSDLIITTGGLGPTEDDITRKAVADAVGSRLIKKTSLEKNIKKLFKNRGYTFTDNNSKQAYLPEGAKAINNKCGTAPGFIINYTNKTLISLPGVPLEMKNMFKNTVLPILQTNKKIIKTRTLHIFGIGESLLESKLSDILYDDKKTNISLLAKRGEIDIKITASGNNEDSIDSIIRKKEEKIRKQVNKNIYGIDNERLPGIIGKLLAKNRKTVSVAESCTAGLLANRITEIPGSSAYFLGGIIVYSNKSKIKQLGISQDILKKYGAVSSQTAVEMAESVREKFSTDYSVSITGIAGPGGGTKNKPVGLVYIALSDDKKNNVYRLNLNGKRNWNRWMSSQYALYYLLQNLKTGGLLDE